MIAWILMGKRWRKCFAFALWGVAITAGVQFTWANENAGIETRAIPNSPMKTLRPAVAASSQEETLQRQLPPAARAADLRALSSAELEQVCLKNPRCGQKLDQMRQGRAATPLPAATVPSQEDKFVRPQLPVPPPPGFVPPLGPKSHMQDSVERFLALLNPFAVDAAWAQTPIAITLTPTRMGNPSPLASLLLAGGMWGGTAYYSLYNGNSTNQSMAENKPYVWFNVILPVGGYYLVDVVASPSLAKLRHWSSQTTDTWDNRAGCGGLSVCHHVTVDLYAAGGHIWYFWADPTVLGTEFYSITIKSYP